MILLAALARPSAAAPGGLCVECHPVHFAEGGPCVACHRGDPRSRRREIAHRDLIEGRFAHFAVPGSPVTERGRKAIERSGCRRCHPIDARGNRLASDLDRLLPRARPAEALGSLQRPALYMPDFRFTDAIAVEIVNALFDAAHRAPPRKGETPLVVHFETGRREPVGFEKTCGGCHRVLTRSKGGLGSGSAGPNLSGLFGEFYPAEFKAGVRWSAPNLRKWIENPRQVRAWATMPPLRLTDEEWAPVRAIFDGD